MTYISEKINTIYCIYVSWYDTYTDIRIIVKMYDTRIRIYILYNYKLYKLTIKIYMY